MGPVREVVALSGRAAVDYVTNFLPRSLNLDDGIPKQWGHDWTSFYWANWYAWAPITALFIAKWHIHRHEKPDDLPDAGEDELWATHAVTALATSRLSADASTACCHVSAGGAARGPGIRKGTGDP